MMKSFKNFMVSFIASSIGTVFGLIGGTIIGIMYMYHVLIDETNNIKAKIK